jgi:hypothetical protein
MPSTARNSFRRPYPIGKYSIFQRHSFKGRRRREQRQVLHHLPDRDPTLVRVNNATEVSALSQSPHSLAQKIRILRNKHAVEVGRPLQQEIVVQLRRSVFLGCQNINGPQAQTRRDGTPHVDIHVKCNAQ